MVFRCTFSRTSLLNIDSNLCTILYNSSSTALSTYTKYKVQYIHVSIRDSLSLLTIENLSLTNLSLKFILLLADIIKSHILHNFKVHLFSALPPTIKNAINPLPSHLQTLPHPLFGILPLLLTPPVLCLVALALGACGVWCAKFIKYQ